MVDQSIHSAVESAVKHFIDLANETLDKSYAYPEVNYDLKGRAAGSVRITAIPSLKIVELDNWAIQLNPVLLMENLNETVNQTIPHEIAHLLDIDLHGALLFTEGGRLQQHGRSWKSIMRLLGVSPDRTHSMDVSNAQTRKHRKVKFQCTGCQHIGEIGIVRANRIKRGTMIYRHKCGAIIQLL